MRAFGKALGVRTAATGVDRLTAIGFAMAFNFDLAFTLVAAFALVATFTLVATLTLVAAFTVFLGNFDLPRFDAVDWVTDDFFLGAAILLDVIKVTGLDAVTDGWEQGLFRGASRRKGLADLGRR